MTFYRSSHRGSISQLEMVMERIVLTETIVTGNKSRMTYTSRILGHVLVEHVRDMAGYLIWK